MGKKSTGGGRTTREAANLLMRRHEVFRRWRSGETHAAIAADLGMSRQLVGLDCKLALEEWRKENRASVSEAVELEWSLLNRLQLELEQAYEDSKDPKRREKLGDWKILVDGIGKISQERRKLLGIDKPTKIESQTTAEVNVSSSLIPLDKMRADIRKHQQAVKARKAQASQ